MIRALSLLFLLSACTYPLAESVTPPPGATPERANQAILTCKDGVDAEVAANEKRTKTMMGDGFSMFITLTRVAAPYRSWQMDKRIKRDVFRECMGKLGYQVREARD